MHRPPSASGFRQAWHIRRAWWACPANRIIHTTWADFTFFHYHKPLDTSGLWWLNDFISRTKTIRMIELKWLMLQSTEKKSRTFLFFSVILIQVLPDLAPSSAKSCTKFCKILHQVLPPLFRSKWSKNAGGCVGHRKRLHRTLQAAALTVAAACMKLSTLNFYCRLYTYVHVKPHIRSRGASWTFTQGGTYVRVSAKERSKHIMRTVLSAHPAISIPESPADANDSNHW